MECVGFVVDPHAVKATLNPELLLQQMRRLYESNMRKTPVQILDLMRFRLSPVHQHVEFKFMDPDDLLDVEYPERDYLICAIQNNYFYTGAMH